MLTPPYLNRRTRWLESFSSLTSSNPSEFGRGLGWRQLLDNLLNPRGPTSTRRFLWNGYSLLRAAETRATARPAEMSRETKRENT